ncbi:hypothetical protein N7492_005009 [Penicillium capsulatum]|uniref:HMG box domain-containing protein n=1 Tax=Penicillium capsulatum TaxID=69766 RepID=A0A9W9I907_9EURO|nr:hypothetical protein N7492_005009 [Penicillium capsulatum]
MSFDRVLPNPAALRYETPQVSLPRPSNLLDHKIMNEPLPPPMTQPDAAACRYADLRPDGGSSTTPLARSKGPVGNLEPLPIINGTRPPGPMIETKDLAFRDRSSISSAGSPIKPAFKDGPEQFCLCQPDPKIPRPRNAFILYRQHYQALVAAHNPGLANPDISKIIGKQWRSLSEEEKNKWRALAEVRYSNRPSSPQRLTRSFRKRKPAITNSTPGTAINHVALAAMAAPATQH